MSDAITTTPLSSASATFWKNKLAAFLHDSPTKALDIRFHEQRADAANNRAGTQDAAFSKISDHTAAAADRIPFPYYKTSRLFCSFDGVANQFHHPLAPANLCIPGQFPTTAVAEQIEQLTQPAHLCTPPSAWADDKKARAEFFAHWRLWLPHASSTDSRFAFLPADTRIPDHTIWTHTSLTAAFESSGDTPALLRFHLAPVQQFIAAARTTRDLWSASYLISWLMVSGLKKLSELAGPDSVIFPNLHGQPLFDLHWKNDLWDQLTTGQPTTGDTDRKPRWENFQHTPSALLTPNLPNVFLAIVPAQTAAQIARDVEATIRSEWKTIAGEVWKFAIAHHSPANEREKRFFRQTDRHLVLSWHATPFPKNLDDAEKLASRLPDTSILERFRTMRAAFEQHMPFEHRDRRFYTDDTKTKLNNIGTAWPLLVALNAWSLDATRKTHPFPAWLDATPNATPQSVATHNTKDVLNGREEMITGGNAQNLDADLTRDARPFFKHEGDEVGATTLIKRLWHRAYLCRHPRWKDVFDSAAFSMPNTRSIANSRPWADDSDENQDNANPDAPGGKYFAILAFDGDNIGRWVSGEKLPPLKTQLADYAENGVRKGALAYFESIPAFKPLLDGPRPLNPACHLQFSESLSNFALHAVPRIIAAHDGRLLYAGGDDVLAMLPATTVLDCADDLQRAFRGISPNKNCGIRQIAPGFLGFGKYEKSDPDHRHPITFPAIDDNNKNLIPHLVPGPRATASCGIAIAHFKSPLQDAVRAAQDAEKRAKKFHPAKHALAINVFKRSGEITQWAARFENDHALDAIRWITHAIDDEILSSKFPHKLLQLTAPYHSAKATHDIPGLDIREVIRHDLDLAMERQRGAKWPEAKDAPVRIRESLDAYLRSLPSQSGATAMIQSLEGLLTVTAFLCRQ